MTLAGIAFGCLIAVLAARFMEPLLFRVSPRDPLVFASVAAILVVVALVASLAPGIRAARVDPLEALRTE
jgi:putative ABC transport system permease protein